MISRFLGRFAPQRTGSVPRVTCSADRVSIHAPDLFCASAAGAVRAFAFRVFALGEVRHLDVDLKNGVGTICFDQGADLSSCLLRLAQQLRLTSPAALCDLPAWQAAPGAQRVAIARRREVVSSWQIVEEAEVPSGLPELAGGVRRVTYLSLAGASFGMAVIGVALPGIPTVPFLLACSYFLVRSSPPLHRRLLDSRIFGPMLRDWHRHRAMRRSVKMFALATLVVVVVVSVSLAGLTPPVALVVVLLALVGVWGIWRIPVIDGNRAESPAFEPPRPRLLSQEVPGVAVA